MPTPLFWSRNNLDWVAIPAREPSRQAKTAAKENLSGRRNPPQTAASSPGSSDRPRIRDDIHLSDPPSHGRRPVRDPNADDVEEATLQDERKRDNSPESRAYPRDNPDAERASIRAGERSGVVESPSEKGT